jgi:hypothetical protein
MLFIKCITKYHFYIEFLPFTLLFRTPGALVLSKVYQNTNFGTFGDVLRHFLEEAGVTQDKPPITVGG